MKLTRPVASLVAVAVAILAVGLLALGGSDARTAGADDPMARESISVSVPRGPHRIAARDYPGREPAIVLMHGFPDDSQLWDPVVARLTGRRVITFDFLGWGQSDKPADYDYTFDRQLEDLEAVVRHLRLERVAVVGHDASVPAAINWALDHPEQTVSVTAMNGFYLPVDGARPPGLIALMALGGLPPAFPLGLLPAGTALGQDDVAQTLVDDEDAFVRVFDALERPFFVRASDAARYIPRFRRQFEGPDNSRAALRSLTRDLFPSVIANGARSTELEAMRTPLQLVWGAKDPDLNLTIPRELEKLVPDSTLTVLPEAHHNLQIDEPQRVADLLAGAG